MKAVIFSKRIKLCIVFICIFMSVPVTQSSAQSVVWSRQVQDHFIDMSLAGQATVDWPSVQVSHHGYVINENTGQQVACGATVPAGTNLLFRYHAQRPTDVSWFAVGTMNDTPYGNWTSGLRRVSSSCLPANRIQMRKVGQNLNVWTQMFADYVVNRSGRTITASAPQGVAGCAYTPANGTMKCSTVAPGTLTATYNIARTSSVFYLDYIASGRCMTSLGKYPLKQYSKIARTLGSGRNGALSLMTASSLNNKSNAKIDIPAQKINCPIHIAPATPTNAPPLKPQISARPACIGDSAQYAFGTNDPNGDGIRYLIDWNNDNTPDQVSPAAGYRNSGELEFVNHVWREPGSYKINVAASDETGKVSPWASATALAVDCEVEDLPIDPNPGFTLPPAEEPPVDPNALPTEPLTPTTTPSHPNKIPGISYPDGEIAFIFDPKITNSTCTAYWSTRYVSDCKFFKGNLEIDGTVDISGELDLEPGTYSLKCTQWSDGAEISKERACTKNINFREI